MQTFLPYQDFTETAAVLDRQRLGKQRVECLQILRTLSGITEGWSNHPAVKMWFDHEHALVYYAEAIIEEWVRRGYEDNCARKIDALAASHGHLWGTSEPTWLGAETFHLSHRSNLVRKMPEHYGALWPDVSPDLPYEWPVA